MANQGAKKRKDENARHLKNLLYVILLSNVMFLVIRAGFMYSSFKWKKHLGGLVLTAFAYILPYQQLCAMARPSYGDDGELIDGGFDMSSGGICGYLHDVIYLTCFVQLASVFSEKFWYIYLVVFPFFATPLNLYMRWLNLLLDCLATRILRFRFQHLQHTNSSGLSKDLYCMVQRDLKLNSSCCKKNHAGL